MRRAFCLAAALTGCARSGWDLVLRELVEDGGDEVMAWGDYAATLDLPDCPLGEALVVDTTADELEGGDTSIADRSLAGTSLSLVEALWIAANRAGQDNIYFDPDVFPAASPAAILLSSDTRVPSFATPVCIDGRGRGVVVDWNAASASAGAMWNLRSLAGAADLQVGLMLLRAPFEQTVTIGAQVAGCRYSTDGREVLPGARSWAIDLTGGRAGPGNVFAGAYGVRAYQGVIEQSWFAVDPLTNTALELGAAIDLEADSASLLLVERNVFATQAVASSLSGGALIFRDNVVEAPTQAGIALRGSIGSVIGPGNVIRGCAGAIGIFDAQVLITQNRIFGNADGIVFFSPAPVSPPTILSATTSQVSGLCGVAGTVELFSDAGDQGEWYIGSVICDSASPWTLSATVPGGRNVTATLTDGQGRTSAFSAPLPVR